MRRRPLSSALALAAAVAAAPASASAEGPGEGADAARAARGDGDTLLYSGVAGDLLLAETARPGRRHALVSTGLASADFARGDFDGVGAGLGSARIPIEVRAAVELRRDAPGPVRDLTLSFGSLNNLAAGDAAAPGVWYESNDFAAAAARVGRDWLVGLAYSAFLVPPELSASSREVAAALRYDGSGPIGRFGPQLKLAAVTSGGPGGFAQLSLGPPELTLFAAEGGGLGLSVPAEVGVGFGDYYGRGTGTTGYAALGLFAALSLGRTGDALWTLSGGLRVAARAPALRRSEPDGHDALLAPEAALALSMVY